jgi:hypothetical protein
MTCFGFGRTQVVIPAEAGIQVPWGGHGLGHAHYKSAMI